MLESLDRGGDGLRVYLRFVGLAEEGVGEGAEWVGGGRPVRGAVVLAGDEVARPHVRRRLPPAPEGGAGAAPITGGERRSARGDVEGGGGVVLRAARWLGGPGEE